MPELFRRLRYTSPRRGSNGGYANLDKVHTNNSSHLTGSEKYGPGSCDCDGCDGCDGCDAGRDAQQEPLVLQDMLLIARDVADRWVCEDCMAFHPVSRSDTPSKPQLSTCPRGWQSSPHKVFGHPSYRLSHRHIQMTFKYLRLKKWRHRLHLHRLLRECHASFTPNPRCTALTGEFSVYPKVVGGRYLLLSTWTFFEGSERVSERTMGALRICEHQSFIGDPRLRVLPPSHHDNHESGSEDEGVAFSSSPATTLSRAITRALNHPHREIRSSCTLCPTDFSVQVHTERVIVRVWQDFGGDGSPLDPAWTIHTAANNRHHHPRQSNHNRESVEHREGSIRDLFGHCVREALREIRNRRESSDSMGPGIMF